VIFDPNEFEELSARKKLSPSVISGSNKQEFVRVKFVRDEFA